MFFIEKEIVVSAAHKLKLDYESKCGNYHGHNWRIVVYFRSRRLNSAGMILDFTTLKSAVVERFDHRNLNEDAFFQAKNPTAENIAKTLCDFLNETFSESLQKIDGECFKVRVQEIDGSTAEYQKLK